MHVICMNDFPVAVAETEQKAAEARAYIQRTWDLVEKVDGGRKVYIRVREVPTVETVEDFHNVFLQKGGSDYQYILNLLTAVADGKPNSMASILQNEDAVQMFKNFQKTYPAIDGLIKKYNSPI